MNCETCADRKKQVESVPYIVHEGEMARAERDKKRWFIAWIVTFVLFLASWAGFLCYESQWEYFDMEITQENDRGINNFTGEGDIWNGDQAIRIIGESETNG